MGHRNGVFLKHFFLISRAVDHVNCLDCPREPVIDFSSLLTMLLGFRYLRVRSVSLWSAHSVLKSTLAAWINL